MSDDAIHILGVDHIGIRVRDAARSEAFFARLGFAVVARHPPAKVVILRNAQGVEVNLIVNADDAFEGSNVLMDDDLPKRAGYTHVALAVPSMSALVAALADAGIAVSEGPVPLGGRLSLFIRDPDRNVIELREAGG